MKPPMFEPGDCVVPASPEPAGLRPMLVVGRVEWCDGTWGYHCRVGIDIRLFAEFELEKWDGRSWTQEGS